MTARDEGAGTVLAIGLVAGLLALTAALLPIVALLTAQGRAAAAADAAALAGADVALGAVAGTPCGTASAVAYADGADTADCRQTGLLVRVEVTAHALGLVVSAAALAGPPSPQPRRELRGPSHPAVYGVRDPPPLPYPGRRS